MTAPQIVEVFDRTALLLSKGIEVSFRVRLSRLTTTSLGYGVSVCDPVKYEISVFTACAETSEKRGLRGVNSVCLEEFPRGRRGYAGEGLAFGFAIWLREAYKSE